MSPRSQRRLGPLKEVGTYELNWYSLKVDKRRKNGE